MHVSEEEEASWRDLTQVPKVHHDGGTWYALPIHGCRVQSSKAAFFVGALQLEASLSARAAQFYIILRNVK